MSKTNAPFGEGLTLFADKVSMIWGGAVG